jgi:hypothetical protein
MSPIGPCLTLGQSAATIAATLGAQRMTRVLFGLIGLWAGWSVLRQHGLPLTTRVSDMFLIRRQNEITQ